MRSGGDALALLCPDWRPASLVYDATRRAVVYSNRPCRQMFDRGDPVRLISGGLSFGSAAMDWRFSLCVDETIAEGRDTSVLIARSAAGLFSVTVHNPQGCLKEVLTVGTGGADGVTRLVVAEIRTLRTALDERTLDAWSRGLDLTRNERAAVDLLARGIDFQDLGGWLALSPSELNVVWAELSRKFECSSSQEIVRIIHCLCSSMPSIDVHGKAMNYHAKHNFIN